MVLYSAGAPVLAVPMFFQMVALIAPVLIFFSGWFPVTCFVVCISTTSCFRVLFQTPLRCEQQSLAAPGSEVSFWLRYLEVRVVYIGMARLAYGKWEGA